MVYECSKKLMSRAHVFSPFLDCRLGENICTAVLTTPGWILDLNGVYL